MSVVVRQNTLISQRVEVALVYRSMLGMDEALAYLQRENVPESIALRVLGDGHARSRVETPASSPVASGTRFEFCRRRNQLHDAIVEAALKIERKLGREWALALLRNEQVPDSVAIRILAVGPRQLRCKTRVTT